MARKYTKVEVLAEAVRERKERLLVAGYVLRPKGRPRKNNFSEAEKKENELILLRMQVELLRNFLSEAGRR